MTELIRHHTPDGYRCGIITQRGRKWMRVHYVADAKPTRLPLTEERYMRPLGDLTPKQRRRFNQSVRNHGGMRGAV